MLLRGEALKGKRSAGVVGIASIISGHGVLFALLRSNAVKQHAFHSKHSQHCCDDIGRSIPRAFSEYATHPLPIRDGAVLRPGFWMEREG
jgi:hypothetical protein